MTEHVSHEVCGLCSDISLSTSSLDQLCPTRGPV